MIKKDLEKLLDVPPSLTVVGNMGKTFEISIFTVCVKDNYGGVRYTDEKRFNRWVCWLDVIELKKYANYPYFYETLSKSISEIKSKKRLETLDVQVELEKLRDSVFFEIRDILKKELGIELHRES